MEEDKYYVQLQDNQNKSIIKLFSQKDLQRGDSFERPCLVF